MPNFFFIHLGLVASFSPACAVSYLCAHVCGHHGMARPSCTSSAVFICLCLRVAFSSGSVSRVRFCSFVSFDALGRTAGPPRPLGAIFNHIGCYVAYMAQAFGRPSSQGPSRPPGAILTCFGDVPIAIFHKGCWSIKTAGWWSWKSKSAKECVTTHLSNQLALEMDGAEACDPHLAIWVSAMPRWVGGHGDCHKTGGASLSGAAVSADLGGSSKYSNENFEGRRGKRFHVNGTCTWVSRS
jgi:hypothetical protein